MNKKLKGLIREEKNLVKILLEVQKEIGYLPKEIMEYISKEKNIPLSKVYRIATFYKAFSLTPKGRFHIKVCSGTACHVRGSENLLNFLCKYTGSEPGKISKDGKYSIEKVNCLGVCAIGPVAVINGKYYGKLNQLKLKKLLEKIENEDKERERI